MVATWVLFRKKHLFAEGHFLKLPLMTLLFSLSYRIALRISYFIFGLSSSYLSGLGTDFIQMPLLDALFALLCFQFPLSLTKERALSEEGL